MHKLLIFSILIEILSYPVAATQKCSGNMQQIYRKTPMQKYDFNCFATLLKSHFGMGVLL